MAAGPGEIQNPPPLFIAVESDSAGNTLAGTWLLRASDGGQPR